MKVWQPVTAMYDPIRRFNRASPYRRALINSGLKRLEIKLLAWLWAGIALLSGLGCQQIYKLYAEDEPRFEVGKSLQTLNMAVSTAKPMNTMPVPQVSVVQSMFHVNKVKTPAASVVDTRRQEIPRSGLNTQHADPRHSAWQLSVQHSAVNELFLADQLANAKSQLQAGHFERARQSFERILMQDPHQVVALAGMLVVSSLRGDIHQREGYLRRLREEIPGYVPHDNLFLWQLTD